MPEIRTGDIETYYEIHGQGQPVVFIHGAWLDSDMWRSQVEYFSRNYRVIVYDIRGHGKSESGGQKHSIDLYAEDLHRLLEHLYIEKPVLCGLSLGGFIVQVYAIKYPYDLQRIILADTGTPAALSFWGKLQKYVLACIPFHKLVMKILGPRRYSSFALALVRTAFGPKFISRKTKKYWVDKMTAMRPTDYFRVFKAMYDFPPLDLSNIKLPVLLTYGRYEAKELRRHAETIHSWIKNSSLVPVPDAGHLLNIDNPGKFNALAESFLDKKEAQAD